MSVQANLYILVGVEHPYEALNEAVAKYIPRKDKESDEHHQGRLDEYTESHLEAFYDSPFKGIENHNGLTILQDGMCGQYCFIGHVLEKSDEHGQGLKDFALDDEKHCLLKQTVKNLIAMHPVFSLFEKKEPTLHIFTRYS